MEVKFVNRVRELTFLNTLYKTKSFQFVPIYGRRRIGKTELVKQFIKDKKGVYYLADAMDEKNQLRILGRQVGEAFGDLILQERGFGDWYSFFRYIQTKSQSMGEKRVMAIDEFPYLARTNPAISSVFQKGIDEYLNDSDVFLILLGSSIGMMEKEVLNYKAPLYGRRTGSLKVEEMLFGELQDFFPHKTWEQLMDIYTVCGVVPGYLGKHDQEENFDQFLLSKVFNKGSFFYEEAEMVLREDFYEPKTYYSILRAIALGRRRLSEIMDETGLEKSKISKYLKVLQDLLVVERDVPITEKNIEKSKKGLFQIRDRYLNFWFRFILGNKNYIEIDRFDAIFPQTLQKIRDFQGFLFEDICRQYLLLNVERYRFDALGRWWDKEEEIDLVAINQQDQEFLFAECKYRNQPTDVDVLTNLERKIKKVSWHKPFAAARLIIFSKNGFTDRLLQKQAQDNRIELISFQNMFL